MKPEEPKGKRIRFSKMGLDNSDRSICRSIRINIKRELKPILPHYLNDTRICIIGGGVSLDDTKDELREQADQGHKLVCTNNSYAWCLDNDFRPSAQVILTSRKEGLRFVGPPVEGCKYFLASQCLPRVFNAVEGRDVYIFHCRNGQKEKRILDKYYGPFGYHYVSGGSTVVLRTIWLMRILGFRWMDIYGCDSCYLEGKHHAYDQPEGDRKEIQWVECEGRKFLVSATMVSQADDFLAFVKENGQYFTLNVHGDGLIAWMIKRGAELQLEKELDLA